MKVCLDNNVLLDIEAGKYSAVKFLSIPDVIQKIIFGQWI